MNSFLGFVFLRNTISPNWYRFGEIVLWAFAPLVLDRRGEWTLTSKKGPFRPRKKNHLLLEPSKVRFKISIYFQGLCISDAISWRVTESLTLGTIQNPIKISICFQGLCISDARPENKYLFYIIINMPRHP